MNKTVSIAFLAVGVLLLILGVSAAESLGSDINRLFTGSPTDKAVWMLVGGTLLSVTGAVGLMRGTRATS